MDKKRINLTKLYPNSSKLSNQSWVCAIKCKLYPIAYWTGRFLIFHGLLNKFNFKADLWSRLYQLVHHSQPVILSPKLTRTKKRFEFRIDLHHSMVKSPIVDFTARCYRMIDSKTMRDNRKLSNTGYGKI